MNITNAIVCLHEFLAGGKGFEPEWGHIYVPFQQCA
jgi:hypothetical protein